MGTGLIRLCQYDCKKAEQIIEQLPPNQRNTCWAMSLLAKCYFELTDYKRVSVYSLMCYCLIWFPVSSVSNFFGLLIVYYRKMSE